MRNLDAFSFFHFCATGVTPAMEAKMVGQGSQYAAASAEGKPLDGGKSYKLHSPPNIPMKNFWSVIVYDNQTHSMIQIDQQFPSISSQHKDLVVNADGSVYIYFGPKPPAHKVNWIQTVLGKGWNTILRLYSPLEPWKVEEARQRAEARLREKMSAEEIASVNASLAHSLAQLPLKRRHHV